MARSIMLDSKPIRCKTHGNADLLMHYEENRTLLLGDHEVFILEGAEATIWEYCNGNTTIRDMVKLLMNEYDVEESVAIENSIAFVQKLFEKKLVKI